jgi:hypothetical protein
MKNDDDVVHEVAPGGRMSSLKYIAEWCHIGCLNITTSHTWANLAIPKHDNARTTDGFFSDYNTPSILPMPAAGVWTRNVGMDAGWEAVLDKFATEEVLPRLANKTAIGVFLGDEMCCRNTSCWHTTMSPISAKLRSLLGKEAILWSNECGIPALFDKLDKIPPDLDWISIDGCELHPSSFNLARIKTSILHNVDASLDLSQIRGTPLHSQMEPRKLPEAAPLPRRKSTLGCRPHRSSLLSLAPLRVRTFRTCHWRTARVR